MQIFKATDFASFSLSSLNNRAIFFTSFIKIVLRKSCLSKEERVAISVNETCGIVVHGEAVMLHPLPFLFQAFSLRWWMWFRSHSHPDLGSMCARLGLNHMSPALKRSSGRVLTHPQPSASCLSLRRFLPPAAWWPWGPTGTLAGWILDSSSPGPPV